MSQQSDAIVKRPTLRTSATIKLGLALAVVGAGAVTVPAPAEALTSIVIVDSDGNVGAYSSLKLDGAGNPVVSYGDNSNAALKLAHCDDPNCAGGDESILTVDSDGWTGWAPSLELDAAGNPVISHYDWGSNLDLKLVHCNDPNCAGDDESILTVDSGQVGETSSLELDAAGNPVISHYDWGSNLDLKLVHCNDPNCAGDDDSSLTIDSDGDVGWQASLELDGSGNPVVSYWDYTKSDLKLLHCAWPACGDGPNNAPVANADSYSTRRDTPLVVAAPGVLSDDSDHEGDPLTAHLHDGAAHGTLTLAADGSFRYLPEPGFVGTDQFTYHAATPRSTRPQRPSRST